MRKSVLKSLAAGVPGRGLGQGCITVIRENWKEKTDRRSREISEWPERGASYIERYRDVEVRHTQGDTV